MRIQAEGTREGHWCHITFKWSRVYRMDTIRPSGVIDTPSGRVYDSHEPVLHQVVNISVVQMLRLRRVQTGFTNSGFTAHEADICCAVVLITRVIEYCGVGGV